jgi:exonuclease VII small subunit
MECLIESKRFISELSHFISHDYSKWIHRGHSKKEAWKITSVCVRRIFEALHSERIVARDILDHNDADFSAAKYLWATWKAHGIISGYLRSRFYEHQSITAVISRHLADNYVKPDDSAATKIASLEKSVDKLAKSLSTLESNGTTLDRNVAAIDKTIKGMQTKLDRVEQRVQKNERPRGEGGRGGN